MSVGFVTTIAGSSSCATTISADGVGTAARFYYMMGVAVSADGSSVYVADNYFRQIRKLTLFGQCSAGYYNPGTDNCIATPAGDYK